MPEPSTRDRVIKLLWQKQFEGSPWHDKFHLMRPDSLEADYGTLADKIIAVVRGDIEECFELKDRRQPGICLVCGEPAIGTCKGSTGMTHRTP